MTIEEAFERFLAANKPERFLTSWLLEAHSEGAKFAWMNPDQNPGYVPEVNVVGQVETGSSVRSVAVTPDD